MVICRSCFVSLVACTGAFASDVVLHESATLGQTGIGMNGMSQIDPNGIVAARFHLDTAAHVSQVGGHLAVDNNDTVFAAVIRLDSPDAIPHGSPLEPDEVLAFTTFAPGYPSNDAFADLNVDLEAGDYALLFGGGLFEATIEECCSGNMPTNNTLLPGASLFRWRERDSGWAWEDLPPTQALRFVVMGSSAGTPVPAASTMALLLMTTGMLACGVIVVVRRKAVAAAS